MVEDTVFGGGRLRLLAAGLVALEAVVVVVYAVVLLIETVFGDATVPAAAAFLVVLFVALGAGLAVCAYGVSKGLRWSRAPVILWQILQVAISPVPGSERWYIAVPMVVVAIVTGALVLRRDVVAAEDPAGE